MNLDLDCFALDGSLWSEDGHTVFLSDNQEDTPENQGLVTLDWKRGESYWVHGATEDGFQMMMYRPVAKIVLTKSLAQKIVAVLQEQD